MKKQAEYRALLEAVLNNARNGIEIHKTNTFNDKKCPNKVMAIDYDGFLNKDSSYEIKFDEPDEGNITIAFDGPPGKMRPLISGLSSIKHYRFNPYIEREYYPFDATKIDSKSFSPDYDRDKKRHPYYLSERGNIINSIEKIEGNSIILGRGFFDVYEIKKQELMDEHLVDDHEANLPSEMTEDKAIELTQKYFIECFNRSAQKQIDMDTVLLKRGELDEIFEIKGYARHSPDHKPFL